MNSQDTTTDQLTNPNNLSSKFQKTVVIEEEGDQQQHITSIQVGCCSSSSPSSHSHSPLLSTNNTCSINNSNNNNNNNKEEEYCKCEETTEKKSDTPSSSSTESTVTASEKKSSICKECNRSKLVPKRIPLYGSHTVRGLQKGVTYQYCTCGLTQGRQPFCDGEACKGTDFEPIPFELDREQSIWILCGCRYTARVPYCDASHTRLEFDPKDPPCKCDKSKQELASNW